VGGGEAGVCGELEVGEGLFCPRKGRNLVVGESREHGGDHRRDVKAVEVPVVTRDWRMRSGWAPKVDGFVDLLISISLAASVTFPHYGHKSTGPAYLSTFPKLWTFLFGTASASHGTILLRLGFA
jgi:hypothetical protein